MLEDRLPQAVGAGEVGFDGGFKFLNDGQAAIDVGNLKKLRTRQLLHIVAVAHPIVAQDVAVVPELLDDLR